MGFRKTKIKIMYTLHFPFPYTTFFVEFLCRTEEKMQAVSKPGLGKRARYYHSQIDMELLRSGTDYVIFICDFDPFGEAKYNQ